MDRSLLYLFLHSKLFLNWISFKKSVTPSNASPHPNLSFTRPFALPHLEPALILHLLQHTPHALKQACHLSWISQITRPRVSVLVSPHPILAAHAKLSRVLIPLTTLSPFPTNFLRIDHNIDLLTMIPTLRILIPGTLNTDMFIHDQQLDVATPLLERLMDWMILVFAYIITDM